MNYLYVNAIVNETYLTANCASTFEESKLGAVSTMSINDDVLKNDIPGILTYFTIKESSAPPLVVLTCTRRHQNTGSVGRYIQSLGWAWSDDLMTEKLDSILSADFYTEEEIDTMVKTNVDIPLPKDKPAAEALQLPALSQPVKQALLTALFLRWIRNEAAIRIAVPKDVDYNSYVRGAIKAIYPLLPVALRAEAGFCSYTPSPREISGRVYIGFIPEALADSNTMFLDGSNQAAINTYTKSTGRAALDTFISYISTADDAVLGKFFADLYIEVEKKGIMSSAFAARDYQPTGESLQIISGKNDPKSSLPSWFRFFETQEKYAPSMQQLILQHIREHATPELLCAHLEALGKDAANPEELCKVLASYLGFVNNYPALRDPLWNTIKVLLKQKAYPAKTVADAFTKYKETLSVFVTDAFLAALSVAVVGEKFQELQTRPSANSFDIGLRRKEGLALLEELQGKDVSVTASLIFEIEGYIQNLDTQDAALAAKKFQEELDNILKLPAKQLYQIRARITALENLQKKLQAAAPNQQITDMLSEVARLLEEKKAQAESSDTKFQRLLSQVEGRTYFEALKVLADPDFDPLDAEDKKELRSHLDAAKPDGYIKYVAAFESYYKKDLVLSSLRKPLEAQVCQQILEDICEFSYVSIDFPANTQLPNSSVAGDKLKSFRNEVRNLVYLVRRIRRDMPLQIRIKDMLWPYRDFLQLLDCNFNDVSVSCEENLRNTILVLMEAGAYQDAPNAPKSIYELFRRKSWDMLPLAQLVLQEAFVLDGTKAYEDYFEDIFQRLNFEQQATLYKNLFVFMNDLKLKHQVRSGFESATKRLAADIRKKEEQERKRREEEERQLKKRQEQERKRAEKEEADRLKKEREAARKNAKKGKPESDDDQKSPSPEDFYNAAADRDDGRSSGDDDLFSKAPKKDVSNFDVPVD